MPDHNDATATFGPIPSSLPSPESRVGERVGGRFLLLEFLGGGGFGIVYRARDERIGDEIALKILRADRMDPGVFERFKQEVRLARKVRGDRLVRIFGLEETASEVFLTMELVDGETLRNLLRRQGPLPIGQALELGRQILQCLQQLHAQDVIHRDIKPANILIDSSGHARLADFGLARTLKQDSRSALTSTHFKLGSAAYMFPETGDAVGPWSDLYSFGIVFFEMLTGRLPFDSADSLELVKAHLAQDPPRVRALNPTVPEAADELVDRLLRKQPRDRHASATDALTALSSGSRTSRRISRQLKRFTAPAPLSAAVLISMVVVGIWWSSRPSQEARHLETPPQETMPEDLGRVEWYPGRGLEGISSSGQTLWQKEPSLGDWTMIRTGRDSPPAVAAIFQPLDDYADLARHELHILDAATGETRQVHAFELDTSGFHNPYVMRLGFSDTFGARLDAADVDGDGADEVFASYLHTPYYPTYALLFEPKLSRETVIFMASGHHRFVGLIDVDGDGLQEALFGGINNLLGYRRALAAVTLPKDGPEARRHLVPWSPESEPFDHEAGLENLLWYALLPADLRMNERDLFIDRQLRVIRITEAHRELELSLGFDGLPWDANEDRHSREQRGKARKRAYSRLRRSERMQRAGRHEIALTNFADAHGLADGARLTQLAEAIEVRRLTLLVEMDRFAEAMGGISGLVEQQRPDWPANAKDTLFAMAKALHLRGRLDEAIKLYRDLLRLTIEVGEGRQSHEPLQKLLMAHLEKRDYKAALQDLESHCSVDNRILETCTLFSSYAQWSSGAPAAPFTWPNMNEAVDRLWYLELRAATSEPRENLLKDLQLAMELDTSTTAMLRVLKGETLLALGRPLEAAETAELALSTWFHHGDPIVERFYGEKVRRRVARIREQARSLEAEATR